MSRDAPGAGATKNRFSALIARVRRSKFVRSVSVVVGGTAASQAIAILATPVITRLYAPEAFGLLGVYNSLVLILAPVVCLDYHLAIVIPRSDPVARRLLALSLHFAALICALGLVVMLIAGEPIAAALGISGAGAVLLLVPAGVFASSAARTLGQWLVRKRRFRPLAAASITQSSTTSVGKIALGLLWPSGAVLIVVTTAGHIARALWLWAVSGLGRVPPADGGPEEGKAVTTAKAVAREYADFPLFHVPNTFAAKAGETAPTIILAALFGPALAGFYELARRIIKIPSNLIANSVSKVYRARAAEAVHAGRSLRGDIARTSGILIGLGIVPYGLVVSFGPSIFSVVFGADWEPAGSIARWLALWFAVHVAVRPATQALTVTRRLALRLLMSLAANAAKLGALVAVGSLTGSVVSAVATYAAIGVAADVVLLTVTLSLTGARSVSRAGPFSGEPG